MKTLKKTLCLILAVVMVVGVLILPAYAADDYTAAITALQNYKVLQGKGDGLIHADDPVTRADMAAIVYRIMTGDTEPAATANQKADAKYGAYADKFKDLTANDRWAKGYIGFCANQGVLKGDEKGNVKPNQQITGYEVQAMLLRAIGYDKNNEYTGSNWEYKVLADATKTGISKGVSTDPANKTPRGAVAQLTVNAAINADRVAPAVYPTVGYTSLGQSLMEEGATAPDYDMWGAPSTIYTVTYTWPDYDVTTNPVVADKALLESWTPVTQAKVYAAAGLTGVSGTLDVYLNGVEGAAATVAAAETSLAADKAIGAQGRWTRVYADRIVYVDTFLSTVGDVNAAVMVGGQEAIPASYSMTTYTNDFDPSDGKTENAYTNAINGKTTSFAKGDVIASNAVPKSGATNGIFSGNDQVDKLVDPYKVTTVSVTVNAIVKDTAGKETGIVGTNGKTYLYNVTYAYNGRESIAKLANTDIGTTFTLYLDAKDNILGIQPAENVASEGVGVVTKAGSYKIEAGSYAAEITVLTDKSTTVTVRKFDSTYDTADKAEQAAEKMLGELVSWVPDTAHAGCSTVVVHTAAVITGSGSTDQAWHLDAGDADAIGNAANHKLVNDETVFFIVDWDLRQSQGGYVYQNVKVVKGFQNIKDLSASNKTTYAAGSPYAGTKDNGYLTTNWTTGIFAATLDGYNKTDATALNSGAWAKYVLVLNGVDETTNQTEKVDNYAYLADPEAFVKVYDQYDQYDAAINGAAHQALKVNYHTVGRLTATGLYTYGTQTNGSWSAVTLSTNKLAGNAYGYTDGVLYDNADAASASSFYTVAKNVSIYLIDPKTGNTTKVNVPLSVVKLAYNDVANTIWWQYDQYGWINVIYVENIVKPDQGTALIPITAATISPTSTSGAIEKLASIDAVKLEATSLTPEKSVKSVSVKWQRIETSGGTRWIDCQAGEVFNDGWTYQAVVTVTAGDKWKFTTDNVRNYTVSVDGLTYTVVAGDISESGTTLTFTAPATVD